MANDTQRHVWVVYNATGSVRLGQFVYPSDDPEVALRVAKEMRVYTEEITVTYGGISTRKCCGQ